MPEPGRLGEQFALGYEYPRRSRTALYVTAADIRITDGQDNPSVMGVTAGGTAGVHLDGGGHFPVCAEPGARYDIRFRRAF